MLYHFQIGGDRHFKDIYKDNGTDYNFSFDFSNV